MLQHTRQIRPGACDANSIMHVQVICSSCQLSRHATSNCISVAIRISVQSWGRASCSCGQNVRFQQLLRFLRPFLFIASHSPMVIGQACAQSYAALLPTLLIAVLLLRCQSPTGAVGGLHLLPFYPSSGDGGFAPITYKEVPPKSFIYPMQKASLQAALN